MVGKKIVIAGGGFAGLAFAQSLKKSPHQLILIDKTNHHLFQPLLYQVATAALSPGEIATPIREILRHQKNTTVMMGEVVSVDKENKTVHFGNGDLMHYDYLILAVGAKHSYFGNDQWEAYAPGLKTITDALKIREKVLLSFEKAERVDDPHIAAKLLNFVIIGGGPTGVEMAGAIAEIAHKALVKNFRRIKPETAKIYLIEGLPHILPVYPEALSNYAKKDLEELGVQVITGKKVIQVTQDGVQLEEFFIESKNVIWAAGNQAAPVLGTLGVPLDRQGRVVVGPDLSLPGHPEIFVIGDAAQTAGPGGKPLPGIAPTAIQQGKYVAKLFKTNKYFGQRPAFRYFDKGSMATIGTRKAVAMVGKFQFTGFIAWFMWCFIHIAYLIGFRNRLSVLTEWLYCFISGQRGVRLIYSSVDKDIPKNPPK